MKTNILQILALIDQESAIQRCIQNSVKHLRRNVLQILQTLHLRCLIGFWLRLCNYFIPKGDCYVVMSTGNIFLYENQKLAKNSQTLDRNIFGWTFQQQLFVLCTWKLIPHFWVQLAAPIKVFSCEFGYVFQGSSFENHFLLHIF